VPCSAVPCRVVSWCVGYSQSKFDLQRRCGKVSWRVVACGAVTWCVVQCCGVSC